MLRFARRRASDQQLDRRDRPGDPKTQSRRPAPVVPVIDSRGPPVVAEIGLGLAGYIQKSAAVDGDGDALGLVARSIGVGDLDRNWTLGGR